MCERLIRRGQPGEGRALQAFTEHCFLGKADGSFYSLMPKLYDTPGEGASDYLVCEENGIVSGLLIAPVTSMTFGDHPVRVGHIGHVCTDPDKRGSGIMAGLMGAALEHHVQERCAVSVLSGARSRYGHFGFCPAGTRYDFTFETANLAHYDDCGLSLRGITDADEPVLRALAAGRGSLFRREGNYAAYLRTWRAEGVLLQRGSEALGFASLRLRDGAAAIGEFALTEPSLLPALLRLVYDRFQRDIRLTVFPWDTASLSLALALCDRYALGVDHLMRVHDWPALLSVLLPLQRQCRPLADGKLVLSITGQPNMLLTVINGVPSIVPAGRETGICLSPEEAADVLLAPFSTLRCTLAARYPVLADWFPLPFSVPENDAY